MQNNLILIFAYARTALKVGLSQLTLRPGDQILVPDFICDVVIHPILQLNLQPLYYPINRDLQPDWELLNKIALNSRPKAIVMTHYFGQAQNIEKFKLFCLRHNLFLVEDNAHGYGGHYKNRSLGTFGDIGISSPRKIIGTPTGGVLNYSSTYESRFKYASELEDSPLFSLKFFLRIFLNLFPRAKYFIKSYFNLYRDWSNPLLYMEAMQPDLNIDPFSKFQISKTNWVNVASERRKNWDFWARFAKKNGLNLVFPEINPESCPWAMPAYANNLFERNQWLAWGATNGVALFPWPSLPAEIIFQDGDALKLWKSLICFPLDVTPNKRLQFCTAR